MIRLVSFVLFACLGAVFLHTDSLATKPQAPVVISYDVPRGLVIGQVAVATVRVEIKSDISRLSVTFSPDTEVKIRSGGEPVDYVSLRKGDVLELRLEVFLKGPSGSVVVMAEAQTAVGSRLTAIALRLGPGGKAASQKPLTREAVITPGGKPLIILPGERR